MSEDRQRELLKKIDWARDRQLAFFGVFFTSLIGIIEIYPYIPEIKLWLNRVSILGLYWILGISMLFSIIRIADYNADLIRMQMELKRDHSWNYKFKRRGTFVLYYWLYDPDETTLEPNKRKNVLRTYLTVIVVGFGTLFFEKLGIKIIKWLFMVFDP